MTAPFLYYMKRFCAAVIAVSMAAMAFLPAVCGAAEKDNIAKTGFGLGVLPKVGFDADNGMNVGVQLNLNNFKDGKLYPNPYSNTYVDFAWYQKGIINLILSHDNRTMIPGARFCTALQYCHDSSFGFCGLNGYQSNWSPVLPDGTPVGNFYATDKQIVNFKVDLVGKIMPHLSWETGYHLIWMDIRDPKGEGDNYLYRLYGDWGLVPMDMISGGRSSELRAGIMYDTRDSEATPSRGIWAETHLIAAPGFIGTTAPYSRFSFNWRHYVPIYKDRLTLAYRLVWQGFFNEDAPWYMMPFYTVCGPQFDRDGMGGFRTLRGIMLNRIQGLQTAIFNTELRWRFIDFRLLNQNVSLCLSGFFEGGKAVKPYNLDFNALGTATAVPGSKEYEMYSFFVDNSAPDKFHLSSGGGFRFIFNRNFVIALELGKALGCTDSRFDNKLQDGGSKPSFYFNTGFTF